MRYINISNDKKRDAKVVYKSIVCPPNVHMAMENGEKPINKRILKGTSNTSANNLLKKTNL